MHSPREISIIQGQEGLTKFHRMFAEIFNESDRVQACPVVFTPHQREEWIHQPRGAVITYTVESD